MTIRYPMINVGQGLLLAGATVAALAMGLRSTPEPGTLWLRTPRRRIAFVNIGMGVWALSSTAYVLSLHLDQRTGRLKLSSA